MTHTRDLMKSGNCFRLIYIGDNPILNVNVSSDEIVSLEINKATITTSIGTMWTKIDDERIIVEFDGPGEYLFWLVSRGKTISGHHIRIIAS